MEAQNLRDSTRVVYTSDHGLCCGHHGIWGKSHGTLPLNMVAESIRVGLIFNLPSRLAVGRRTEFMDHLDLFQTLLAYAGVDPRAPQEKTYPGRSYWPLLEKKDARMYWREVKIGEYDNVRMVCMSC